MKYTVHPELTTDTKWVVRGTTGYLQCRTLEIAIQNYKRAIEGYKNAAKRNPIWAIRVKQYQKQLENLQARYL